MKFSKINKNDKNFNLIRKKIYLLLITKIPNSIFNNLGYDFFKLYCNINYMNIFYYLINDNVVSLISYIEFKNQKILEKIIINFLFKNPFKLFFFLFNLNFYFKSDKRPNNYVQLLHLILDKKLIKNKFQKKKRDQSVKLIHKKFVKKKYIGIYANFNKLNIPAKNYYKNNGFKEYYNNLFFSFVKKKIN